jgi:hypothetical protein
MAGQRRLARARDLRRVIEKLFGEILHFVQDDRKPMRDTSFPVVILSAAKNLSE